MDDLADDGRMVSVEDVFHPGLSVRIEPYEDRVIRVVLDRPPVNAADTTMLQELQTAFESMHERDVDTVVLTGAGRTFCGGNELREFASMNADEAETLMLTVRRAFWALYDCPVPVIASVIWCGIRHRPRACGAV